jgi:hypothetical protein
MLEIMNLTPLTPHYNLALQLFFSGGSECEDIYGTGRVSCHILMSLIFLFIRGVLILHFA